MSSWHRAEHEHRRRTLSHCHTVDTLCHMLALVWHHRLARDAHMHARARTRTCPLCVNTDLGVRLPCAPGRGSTVCLVSLSISISTLYSIRSMLLLNPQCCTVTVRARDVSPQSSHDSDQCARGSGTPELASAGTAEAAAATRRCALRRATHTRVTAHTRAHNSQDELHSALSALSIAHVTRTGCRFS